MGFQSVFSEDVWRSEAVPRKAWERPCSLAVRERNWTSIGWGFSFFKGKLTITDLDKSMHL